MQQAQHARGWNFLPKLTFVITIGLITAATGFQASAVDVFTDPVGFVQVNVTNSSDTLLSVPFVQIPQFRGAITSVAGNVITAGSPGWSVGQWSTPSTPNNFFPFYVYMVSGAQAGATYTITNNDATTLTLATTTESFAGLAAGDLYQIIPFWTLGTVWPGGAGIVASTGSTVGTRHTQILFPDLSASAVNLSPSAIYYFFNNAWRKAGAFATSNFNDVVILPDQYVKVRQALNPADNSVTMTIGQVPLGLAHIALFASNTGSVDNSVAIARPSVNTLLSSGLTNPAFIASTGSTIGTRQDQLFVYDNTAQAQNKSPSGIYYFFNNGWRKSGTPAIIDFSTSNVFDMASGVIIRRALNATPEAIWINPPNY